MAVLLTRRSVAKRVYATVLNAGNNTDGYKEQGEARRHVHLLIYSSSLPLLPSCYLPGVKSDPFLRARQGIV